MTEWTKDAGDHSPAVPTAFRNVTPHRIDAYGYVFMPSGHKGDMQTVSEATNIRKFSLYETLEVVEDKSGFKVDGRWSEARKQAEYEKWLTQQPS